jgi:hypothetical protein
MELQVTRLKAGFILTHVRRAEFQPGQNQCFHRSL